MPPPAIPLDDRGLLLGDGLFETILAKAGKLILLDAHLARLARGCDALGLPRPDEQAARALCAQAPAGLQADRAAVRLTLTAGSGGRGLDRPEPSAPRLFATAAPSARPEAPARLINTTVRRNAGSPTARLKTLAYLDNVLARREALAAGADEALMLNAAGEVACASAANIFWVAGGVLHTPALACGVLDGIVRGEVIARARLDGMVVRETHAGVEGLYAAEGVFLTSSLAGVRPVRAIDGRALGESALIARLGALLADVT